MYRLYYTLYKLLKIECAQMTYNYFRIKKRYSHADCRRTSECNLTIYILKYCNRTLNINDFEHEMPRIEKSYLETSAIFCRITCDED